jgi:glycosyltransferase involved in cell wall biosynthesis
MATGVPCVAPRINGLPELIRDGIDGLLFTASNVEELPLASSWTTPVCAVAWLSLVPSGSQVNTTSREMWGTCQRSSDAGWRRRAALVLRLDQ